MGAPTDSAAAKNSVHTGTFAHRGSNELLDALSPADRERWFAQLTPVFVQLKTVLFEPGQVIDFVYFPLNAVIALVTPLRDGGIVEVATVGNEGVVGVPHAAGRSLAVRAIAQVAGWLLPMGSQAFLRTVGAEPAVQCIVDDYVQALFGQVAQVAACNRLHSNEERLTRWLLMSHDRVGADEFGVTHEFLGQLLGSRRATVTISANILQASGFIRYRRGIVTILDRPGLEAVTCECYGVMKAETDNVLCRADLRGHGTALRTPHPPGRGPEASPRD